MYGLAGKNPGFHPDSLGSTPGPPSWPLHDPDNHDGVITHLEPDIIRKHLYEQSWGRWWNSSWAVSNPKRWCCESAALYMPANLEYSAVATGLEKVSFHSNPKERQCQRMFKLLHDCTHLTHYQTNAQNSLSQASTVHELWTSRCSSCI